MNWIIEPLNCWNGDNTSWTVGNDSLNWLNWITVFNCLKLISELVELNHWTLKLFKLNHWMLEMSEVNHGGKTVKLTIRLSLKLKYWCELVKTTEYNSCPYKTFGKFHLIKLFKYYFQGKRGISRLVVQRVYLMTLNWFLRICTYHFFCLFRLFFWMVSCKISLNYIVCVLRKEGNLK